MCIFLDMIKFIYTCHRYKKLICLQYDGFKDPYIRMRQNVNHF